MDRLRTKAIVASAALLIAFAGQERTHASTPHSTVLHIFTGGDGADPREPLVDLGGVLYGTTYFGGPFGGTDGCGTIFSVTRGGAFTSLYSFLGRGDGCRPQRLVRGPDGLLYGTTAQQPGSPIWGTFFRITPSGEFATLYVFRRNADGYAPGPLVLATDGFFYGVTGAGGANGLGTAFRLSTDGRLTVLRAFQSTDPIGAGEPPVGPLVQGSDGNLYGSTGNRLFRMTLAGDLSPFGSPFSSSAIIAGRDGRLYGGAFAPKLGSGLFTVSPSGDFAFGPFDLEGDDFRVQFQRRDNTLFGITNLNFSIWKGVAHLTSHGVSLAPNSFDRTIEPPPIFQRVYQLTSMIDGEDGGMYATTAFDGSGFGTIVRFALGRPAPLDFSGVGRSNRLFWRPGGTWFSLDWGNPVRTLGATGDVPVPGDYDGDGRQDLAVFRRGEGGWYIEPSSIGAAPIGAYWGVASDRPVPADYDGDGKTDIAVFRPSTGDWYVIPLSTRVPFAAHWGANGDIPVPADYDGDGKTDLAVFRPSNGAWYIQLSTGGSIALAWGAGRDIPVPGDYDGDGKADLAVFRPDDGTWYVLFRTNGTAIGVPWGAAGDVPICGDFDGDGRFDYVVYRAADHLWYERYANGFTNSIDFSRATTLTADDAPITNRP
jgi:uncharacterized repeat protein (TIGR03803 family)